MSTAAEVQAKKLELAKLLKPVIKFQCQKGNSNPFTFMNTSDIPIEGVKPNCPGCTKITNVTKDSIKGIFKVGDQYPFSNEDAKLYNEQGFIIKEYTNFLTIYFEDGQPVNYFNNGVLINNPLKLSLNLEFKADVTVYK